MSERDPVNSDSHVVTLSDDRHVGRRQLLGWLSTSSVVILAACSSGGGASSDTGGTDTPSVTPPENPVTTPPVTTTPPTTPTTPTAPSSTTALFNRGVAMTSMEGSGSSLPGTLGGEVFLTPDQHFSYYASKGMDHIRLEGAWERLQPSLFGQLGEQLLDPGSDPNDPLRNPVAFVTHDLDRAKANNLKVILDLCHNYGRRYVGYNGNWANKKLAEIGSSDVSIDAFVDYCVKTVKAFGNHPAVAAIELMNEPHDLAIGDTGWTAACQAAITAIRAVNTRIAIVVDGYNWASAAVWPNVNTTIHTLSDPNKNLIWSAHVYFDADGSGTYGGGGEAAPADQMIGVKRLQPFLDWLKQHGFTQAHIGEFGAPNSSQWTTIVDNFVSSAAGAKLALSAHQDIPYLNDPYQMNLFPQTNAAGVITGADKIVLKALQAL